MLGAALPCPSNLLLLHDLYQQFMTILDSPSLRGPLLSLEALTAPQWFCSTFEVKVKTGCRDAYVGDCKGRYSYLWRACCAWLFFNIKAYKF